MPQSHLTTAAEQVLGWADRHGLRRDQGMASTIAAARPWDVAALLYPDAAPAATTLAAQWLAVNFVVDDLLDGDLDPARCAVRARAVLAALDADGDSSAAPGLHSAIRDLWRRTIAERSPAWSAALRAELAGWLAAYSSEAAVRAEGRTPRLDEYLEHRRASSGMGVFIALVEPAVGVDLDSAVRSGAPLPALRAVTATHLGVLNDLFSAAKERAAGQVHNAVCVLMAQNGLEFAEARYAVEELLTAAHQRFDALAATVRHPDAARCVAGCRALMTGARTVCEQLERYAGGAG